MHGPQEHSTESQGSGGTFDFDRDYAWQEQLYGLEGRPPDPVLANGPARMESDRGDAEGAGGSQRHYGPQWVYLRLGQPVTAPAVRPGAAVSRIPNLSQRGCAHGFTFFQSRRNESAFMFWLVVVCLVQYAPVRSHGFL